MQPNWDNLTVGTGLLLIDDRTVYWQANGANNSFTATWTNEDDIPCLGTFYRDQVKQLA